MAKQGFHKAKSKVRFLPSAQAVYFGPVEERSPRLPVTEKIAGSNPVGPAVANSHAFGRSAYREESGQLRLTHFYQEINRLDNKEKSPLY